MIIIIIDYQPRIIDLSDYMTGSTAVTIVDLYSPSSVTLLTNHGAFSEHKHKHIFWDLIAGIGPGIMPQNLSLKWLIKSNSISMLLHICRTYGELAW